MTADTRTTVMLVDDHSIMRDLLRDALEDTGEFRVVAQAADGKEVDSVTDLESADPPHPLARVLVGGCWNH